MPKKIQNFARSALVQPGLCTYMYMQEKMCVHAYDVFHLVTVNVGRAGAASLDVIQEVDYVKQEAKVVYLLECLQKTPPPVGAFCFLDYL